MPNHSTDLEPKINVKIDAITVTQLLINKINN